MTQGSIYISRENGETFVQVSEIFTKRFLDREDYDLINAGCADMAGVYAGAVKLISTKTGEKKTVKMSKLNLQYKLIQEENIAP
tara:strand:- start:242 stop:493 length:252 start_codon:yes stop_codon:yes gene_type:complete